MNDLMTVLFIVIGVVCVCFLAKCHHEADVEVRASVLNSVKENGLEWSLAELALTKHNTAKIYALKEGIKILQSKLENKAQ